MWRRVPWKVWIGIGLILAGAALFGGWQWWMATRTWVPLEMPISLAQGHIRSPEFKINVDSGFWIWVEVETQVGDDDVSCLIGYRSDYCEKNNVHELRAVWTLSQEGKPIAGGPTDRWPGVRGGMESKARGLGSFVVPPGDHYVLDLDIPEDYSRFDAGHPRLAIITTSYWVFENEQTWIFLLSTLLAVVGIAMILHPLAGWIRKKRDYQSISFTFPGRLSSGFVRATEPFSPENSRPPRISSQVWIGLALFVLGFSGYFGIRHWYKTRIFEAVDMPVSLVKGHVRTGPFRLNLSATYYVRLDAGEYQWYYLVQPPCGSRELLKTKWTLVRNGKIAQEEWRQFWRFDSKPGWYDLDLEILADASCLNRYHPRLQIYTDRADYEFLTGVLELIAALLAATGASLFVLALRFRQHPKPVTLNLSPNHSQNIQWTQRLPLRPPISRMPGFGVIAGTVFGFLAIQFMLLAPITPRGLWVHLLKPGETPTKPDAWTEPLVVMLKDEGVGQEPKLLVNSKETGWDDLDRTLKHGLAPRKDWVVYVGGDDAVAYTNIATVIDAARSRGAKVVLFDPHEQHGESPGHARPPRR